MVSTTSATISTDRLSQDLEANLDPHCERVQFARGDRLFKENDPSDGFYIIDEGVVRVQAEFEEVDTDSVLGYLGPGATLGEQSLLDGLPRAASAYAEEPSRLRKFPLAHLDRIEREDPTSFAAIFRHLGHATALKLRSANARILGLAVPHASEDSAAAAVMVAEARRAQEQFLAWSEDRVDALLEALADSIASRASEFAEQTVAVTRMGNADDKTRKNRMASLGVLRSLAKKPGVGLIAADDGAGVSEFASPAGVVFGLIPMTNPVATAIFKSLICLKSRNAIILSFHRATRELGDSVGAALQQALARHDAPDGLIQWVQGRNSRGMTEAFFHDPGVSLLLATGGRSMVKAAYSSGKPALGVGPGNAPAFIALDCDLDWAARCIVESKSFDNGIICGSEHNLVVPAAVRAPFCEALELHGAAVLDAAEAAAFTGKCIVTDRPALRRTLLGRSAAEIAALVGVKRGHPIRLIVVPASEISGRNALALEKMAPVAGLFEVRDEAHAMQACLDFLALDGRGHTAVIHSRRPDLVREFATLMPASRILAGAPASQGVVGFVTGLVPSFMLGCGMFGGSSTGDNVTYTHVRNVKRLATFLPPSEGI